MGHQTYRFVLDWKIEIYAMPLAYISLIVKNCKLASHMGPLNIYHLLFYYAVKVCGIVFLPNTRFAYHEYCTGLSRIIFWNSVIFLSMVKLCYIQNIFHAWRTFKESKLVIDKILCLNKAITTTNISTVRENTVSELCHYGRWKITERNVYPVRQWKDLELNRAARHKQWNANYYKVLWLLPLSKQPTWLASCRRRLNVIPRREGDRLPMRCTDFTDVRLQPCWKHLYLVR